MGHHLSVYAGHILLNQNYEKQQQERITLLDKVAQGEELFTSK